MTRKNKTLHLILIAVFALCCSCAKKDGAVKNGKKGGKDTWVAPIILRNGGGARAVLQTDDGRYVILSNKGSEKQNDWGAAVYIAKFDARGACVLETVFRKKGWSSNMLHAIATRGGGFAFIGNATRGASTYESIEGELLIVNYGPDGKLVWSKTLKPAGYYTLGIGIRQTKDGDFIVTASSSLSGKDERPVTTLKISASGDIMTRKTEIGEYHDASQSVSSAGGGGYIAIGRTAAAKAGKKTEFYIRELSDSLEEKSLKTITADIKAKSPSPVFSVLPLTGGDIVFLQAYSSDTYISDKGPVYVARINSEGKKMWRTKLSSDNYDTINAIIQTKDGGFVLVGSTACGDDSLAEACERLRGYDAIWIVKLNAAGKIQWEKAYGSGHNEYAVDIQETWDGGFIVAANSDKTAPHIELSRGILLMKLDKSGNCEKCF